MLSREKSLLITLKHIAIWWKRFTNIPWSQSSLSLLDIGTGGTENIQPPSELFHIFHWYIYNTKVICFRLNLLKWLQLCQVHLLSWEVIVGSEGINFDFWSPQSPLLLNSSKCLTLLIVWIFIIIFYTKRGETSDSTSSSGIFGLIWYPNDSMLT